MTTSPSAGAASARPSGFLEPGSTGRHRPAADTALRLGRYLGTDLAQPVEEHGLGEGVSGFPLVEARRDAASQGRILIRERTVAGLKAARARGRKGGRPPKLSAKEIKTIRTLLKTADIPVAEIAARFGVARSTLYRAVLNPAA